MRSTCRVAGLLLVLCLALWGCSSGEDGDVTTTHIVNGTFRGTWQSARVADHGTVVAVLTQDVLGDDIAGTVTFTDSPCFATGRIDGTNDQNQIDAEVDVGNGQEVHIDATVSATTALAGSYTVSGGQCDGDQGGFSLAKVSGGSSPSPPPSQCCRVCTIGKACGNTCIAANLTCRTPPGCACNG